ncbi:Na+/H+ antiporter [Rhizosphaericola mali]|uniref:Na+/H+ antiporter n=1 Tax=Rhizosphaericola mali TaxID=2545455 RepID=A0A5P2G4D3_9BACT|nr:Na+/H+ antiporter [Rhizosphaericola mali]QES90057.1 Na+/H+ antiporter [Rhizosphaericola mali]
MLTHFPFILGMIIAIILIIMLSNKIKIAYPILLVVAGLLISLIPSVPNIKIDSQWIFILFLPPLLYEAAWTISWKELWFWRRIVSSFAFVVVFLTAISVAYVANAFIPGISIALGFLLGGIVSPPDAVSASAILQNVEVPKRMSIILEGESLLNDASSLIIFRFAMIAVGTGQFVWHEAALSFLWMIVGGGIIGLLLGYIIMKFHQLLPTDANMDTLITLVTPYTIYLAAEEVHSSGVLAVVCGGLFLSYHKYAFLKRSSRLRNENVWSSLVFLLNGIVFFIIGLDLPEILQGLQSEGISLGLATKYGLIITGTLILGRIIAAYGAVVVTLIMRNFITVADSSNPGFKVPIILGWTGMRGVVSLAAALSIPVYLKNGTPFPHRNLILYITFVVILGTLIIQGLTLPILLKKFQLPKYKDHYPEHEATAILKNDLAKASLEYIQTNYSVDAIQNFHLKKMVLQWEKQLEAEDELEMSNNAKKIYLDILDLQRKKLIEKNRTEPKMDEDVINKYLHLIDLEEEKIKAKV